MKIPFSSLLVVLGSFLILSPLSADEHHLDINAVPVGTIPAGSSADLFSFGYGINAEGAFHPAGWSGFGLGLNLEYLMIPIQTEDSIYLTSASTGPAFRYPLNDRLVLFAYARAGLYYFDAMGWSTSNGGGFCWNTGGGAAFVVKEPFSIGLGVSFNYYNELYNGLVLSLYGRMDLGFPAGERALREYSGDDGPAVSPMEDEKGKGVELRNMELTHLFPVLYKYYDGHPVGTVRVKNFESKKATDITVEFYMERYMDNPMTAGEPFELKGGEERVIELYGLFTEDMMEITEGSKASARVNISYEMGGKSKSRKYNPVLQLNNRNALSWDDDKKIASFITAKDPEILTFSKKVNNWMQEFENPAVDENLQKGIVLFEAIRSYGIRYEIDPTTPFIEFSEQKDAVDFIQFPRQTLNFTTGDCDDLTALYAALLESVGVDTGIITIPGHIYMAFALKSPPDELRKGFSRLDDLIISDNKAWLPVEITLFQKGFDEAWTVGAKQWRDSSSKEQAAFFSTAEAWSNYQAVGFRDNSSVDVPSRSDVTSAFVKVLSRFVEQEIWPEENRIREQMASSSKSYIHKNRLAVLYARYGLYDEALTIFDEINREFSFVPTLLNTGNIHFLRQDFEEALEWYEKVLDDEAGNRKALLGIARCNHEMENYGTVRKSYQQLKSLDPELAGRFAYLDLRGEEGHRAAESLGLKNTVLWEDEP